jgi:hypothetical protein
MTGARALPLSWVRTESGPHSLAPIVFITARPCFIELLTDPVFLPRHQISVDPQRYAAKDFRSGKVPLALLRIGRLSGRGRLLKQKPGACACVAEQPTNPRLLPGSPHIILQFL